MNQFKIFKSVTEANTWLEKHEEVAQVKNWEFKVVNGAEVIILFLATYENVKNLKIRLDL